MSKHKDTTEQPSNYDALEHMHVGELLLNINREDKTVPVAVEKQLPQIQTLVEQVVNRLKKGGRLFYIGAGTSGRLGIVDASECPPTFGVEDGLVIGIMAGGDKAIRKAAEFAEDNMEQGWKDLMEFNISDKDVLIGLAASGRTPYVIGAIENARKNGLVTGCITCNNNTQLAKATEYPIEVIVGPEFVTGSTRMKAGTAQKLVLNMISTATMIQLDKVKGNKMVDMQLTNNKLVGRGTRMIMDELDIVQSEAEELLLEYGSVRKAVEVYLKKKAK